MKKYRILFLALQCVHLSLECLGLLKKLLKRKKEKKKEKEEEEPDDA